MIGIIKDCIGIGFQWKIETDIDVTGVKNIVDKLQELMTITMEECGELIQQCSKAIRWDDYRDNENLIEEVGDVLVMIDLIKKRGLLKSKDLESRMKVKKEKLKKWSNLVS